MMKNLNRLRIWILLLPAVLFIISLTQVAFTNEYNDEIQVQSAFLMFIMGPTLIMGGAGLEWLTWMANPLAIWAAYRFFTLTRISVLEKSIYKIDNKSMWLSIIAAAIAWSFSLWDEVLASESGTTGKILSFEPGYWIWAVSILSLAIGISLYYTLINKVRDRMLDQ